MTNAQLIERIEQIQFCIESEVFESPDQERLDTLTKRQERVDNYAVRHFGQVIINE